MLWDWTEIMLVYPDYRQMADFPTWANKDTLLVYNITFESHWSAHLRTDISSYEEVAILREIALKCKNERLKKCIKILL